MFKLIDWVVDRFFDLVEWGFKIVLFLLIVGFVVGSIALAIWWFF